MSDMNPRPGMHKGKRVIIVDEQGMARIPPTPERLAQARCRIGEEGEPGFREVVTEVKDEKRDVLRRSATVRLLDDDLLSYLFHRKQIDLDEFECGQQYVRHHSLSGLAGGVVDLSQERVDGGEHKPSSETRLWHLQKWMALDRAVGTTHGKVLRACLLPPFMSLEDYGRQKGKRKNAKQAKEWTASRLTAALEELVIVILGERKGRPAHVHRDASAVASVPGGPGTREIEVSGGRRGPKDGN